MSLPNLYFGDLEILYILGPTFALWALAWFWTRPRERRAVLRFSSFERLGTTRAPTKAVVRRVVQGFRVVIIALLVMAMMRPQTGRKLTSVETEGIDIVLVLDTSGSMAALDLDSDQKIADRRSRLAVAKAVVRDFVGARENDQVGLVVFGEQAFTQCPLTLDHGVVQSFLGRLEIGMAGDATAIGSALGTAVKRLKDSQAKSKVVILLTDGRNNAGQLPPLKAAEIAESLDVKVYTVGAGTRGRAPFLVQVPGTRRRQVVHQDVEIDEATLREIAEKTGGAYFRAEDQEALASIYEQIDQLETTEIVTDSWMEFDEKYNWLAIPALFLFLLERILLGTRLRRLP